MKKWLILLLKFAVSIAILTWLFLGARDNLQQLQSHRKDWPLLGLALLLTLGSVTLCFVRWHLLVRALDIPFRLRDAFRLGFLGYMLNFVSLGSVGGDLFKAIFLAREQPGRRALAVATVFFDRLVGLFALLLVASGGILYSGLMSSPNPELAITSRVTLIVTAVATVGFVLLLIPGFTQGKLSQRMAQVPRVGHVLERLLWAVRMYRRRMPVVWISIVMSLGVHALSSLSIFCIASGLPGAAPSLGSHFVIVPLAILASTLPLPLSGLGAMEFVMDALYVQAPSAVPVTQGTGFIAAIAYRMITIVVAIIGFGYYLTNRSAVQQVMHETEAAEAASEQVDAEGSDPAQSTESAEVKPAAPREPAPLRS